MQHGSFISLAEAVALTGVSASTLSRFAEAGYFATRPVSGNEHQFELDRGEICTLFKIIEKPNAKSVVSGITVETKDTLDTSNPSLADAIEVSESASETVLLKVPVAITTTNDTADVINAGGAEIRRLRALVELHEKYIEFKESQVASLTEERNWLRTRIEKLEEKAERDQVIMASLSETQRGLVAQIAHKKTALQAALEWIGVTQPEPQPDDSRP